MGHSRQTIVALAALAALCLHHSFSFVLGPAQGVVPNAVPTPLSPAIKPSVTDQPGRPTIGLAAGGLVLGLCLSRLSKLVSKTPWHQAAPASLSRMPMRYTTAEISPAFIWLKTGLKVKDLPPGELRVVCLGGCDIAVGKTEGGKLFAIGDKAPPTGISFSLGSEIRGDCIVEQQYGNAFNVFNGEPEGNWCPSPPIIGGLVGAFMGGPTKVAVYDARESWFAGEIEVQVDSNAKRAYEADYWKGVLDAQGKDDGTYY